jgi:hypothetical protein
VQQQGQQQQQQQRKHNAKSQHVSVVLRAPALFTVTSCSGRVVTPGALGAAAVRTCTGTAAQQQLNRPCVSSHERVQLHSNSMRYCQQRARAAPLLLVLLRFEAGLSRCCCCLLCLQVFTAISDELRAKSNVEMGKSGIHK